jgi:phosphoribosyl-dephospho-CoA transferase
MTCRHDLVWLTRAGWHAAVTTDPGHGDALRDWYEHDWPAVARRQDASAGDDVICLGMPLPLSSGVRQRLSLAAHVDHIARRTAPVTLADALAAAPPPWLAGLVALARDAAGMDLRVYGSLAMASVTGAPYLRPESDIDLLLRPSTRAELRAGLGLLARHAAVLPLDGEIVFPSGDAVAWKEWIAARRDHARVLAKSLHAVRLLDPALLDDSLPP